MSAYIAVLRRDARPSHCCTRCGGTFEAKALTTKSCRKPFGTTGVLAHGLLPDGTPYGADAIYGSWLIFHLCMPPLFPIRTQLMLPFDDVAQDQASAPNPDPT